MSRREPKFPTAATPKKWQWDSTPWFLVAIMALFFVLVWITVFMPLADQRLYQPSARTYTYNADAQRGRAIYQREGCWYCHTQQVRPVKADSAFGPVSLPSDYARDKPVFLGTERTGPDLAWVGDRLPDDDFIVNKLKNPRAFIRSSIMPRYDHLSDDELHALAAYLISLKSGSTGAAGDMQKVQRHAHETPPPQYNKTNPVPASMENIAQGKRLYDTKCAGCHGIAGKGGGPLRAADFTDEHFMGEATDGFLFWRITDGKPGTPMPAFETLLNETQRWQLVHYLRTFAPGSGNQR